MNIRRLAAAVLTAGTLIVMGAPLRAEQIIERGYVTHRGTLRVLQDYHLGPNDAVRQATVIYGNAVIDGLVDWDLQVAFGDLRLTSTAVVNGSVVVTAGNVTIEDGATIRGDLVVIGGAVTAPPMFTAGGSHVLVGDAWVGRNMRTVMPWITRGLMWGRVIVPDLRWVWGVLLVFFILTLAINTLLHEPVGAFAANLGTRPFSAFTTGLLVLLLAGPVVALLAATIIGIAIIPFFLCAIVIAWVTGKVGVLRWIGRTIFSRGAEPETRLEAMGSVAVGFVAITLLYLVPVVGLVTWAMVGVFGLGAATQHFLGGLRRERPQKPPKEKAAPAAPAVPASPLSSSAAEARVFEPAADEPLYASAPPVAPMPPPPPPPPPMPHYAPGDRRAYPHASFLDRLAALGIDVILIAVIASWMVSARQTFDDEPYFPMLFFAYSVLFWAWQGTTLGGIVCNLRLARVDGKPIAFVDAVVRGLGGVLSVASLGIGFLWILRDPQQQSWHDKIAGTIVVKVPKGTPLD